MRCLIAALLLLALPSVLAAQDLCEQMLVPAELELACEPAPGGDGILVAPTSAEYRALTQLALEPLDRAKDKLAFDDPEAWLQAQVTPDLSRVSRALEGLADNPDSPFAGEAARDTVGIIDRMIQGVATLPLNACRDPIHKPGAGYWSMRCDFSIGGFGSFMEWRLIDAGSMRYAARMRTMNEDRLEQLEAIVNTFKPAI